MLVDQIWLTPEHMLRPFEEYREVILLSSWTGLRGSGFDWNDLYKKWSWARRAVAQYDMEC